MLNLNYFVLTELNVSNVIPALNYLILVFYLGVELSLHLLYTSPDKDIFLIF